MPIRAWQCFHIIHEKNIYNSDLQIIIANLSTYAHCRLLNLKNDLKKCQNICLIYLRQYLLSVNVVGISIMLEKLFTKNIIVYTLA